MPKLPNETASRGFSTLEQWLAWFETLHPKQIDFGLDRIRYVLGQLSLSRPPYRVVTVGGTNGKGSCVALLESIYRAAGYRVGAFTSPHLLRFNERIRFDGRDASDAELIGLFERIERALGAVTLSYFESSAVAAMLYFAEREADVAVLEVGMGGRLDAVNVYDADAALIVSIDLEHQEWLGPDREAIGREKAGIMRAGRPVVVADRDPPRSLAQTAEAVGARLELIGRDFECAPAGGSDALLYRAGAGERRLPRPSFGGAEQIGNAGACVRLVECLAPELPVGEEAVARGVAGARLAGRAERHVVDAVEWVFDVAHNPAAAARFAASLESLPRAAATSAVFGGMRDKDLAAVFTPFTARVDRWFVASPDSERAASAPTVAGLLASLGARGVAAYTSVAEACAAARAGAAPGERVIVFGSFYTVGPALAALGIYSASST